MKKLFDFLFYPFRVWKEHRAFKKKLKELRARDPFIYK